MVRIEYMVRGETRRTRLTPKAPRTPRSREARTPDFLLQLLNQKD